ncbi:MAG: prephenate dehydrogenase/arogenate dehydrogenase family protein [Bacteroidota bacterium]
MPQHAPLRRITIIGVGLIGGSLGMAVRKNFPEVLVTGVDRPSVLRAAKQRKAIHKAERNLSKALAGADLVILATPGKLIQAYLPKIARIVPPETLVTDVGSVKKDIANAAKKWFPFGNFIGGHPMAGIELSGIQSAHPLLFENAIYVLTPTRANPRSEVRRLIAFVQAIGARPLLMDAARHDAVASAVSHVPQLVAVAMMNLAGRDHREAKHHLRLGAGGFRDLTRIASSPFGLWSQILPANRAEISRSLRLLEKTLASYRRDLENGRIESLAREFRSSRGLRDRIPKDMKGFVHRLETLEVFVSDKPGGLARLTGALAKHRINIKDIELMKVREGTGGTFRLSFETGEERVKARQVLQKRGFEIGR